VLEASQAQNGIPGGAFLDVKPSGSDPAAPVKACTVLAVRPELSVPVLWYTLAHLSAYRFLKMLLDVLFSFAWFGRAAH
jgi:hypothetical protein